LWVLGASEDVCDEESTVCREMMLLAGRVEGTMA
jgi:hypothetical protein